MKKILIVLCLISLVLPVFAANWVQYDNKGWYDADSAKYDGQIISVWFKNLNPGDWELVNNKKIWYEMTYLQAKCGQRQLNIKHVTKYDLKGNVIKSLNFSYPDWFDVIPDTIGEEEYYIMCGTR